MEVETLEQLRDLRHLLDSVIGHLESDPPLIQDKYPELMTFDIILGGRFGIVDLKKRKESK